jgi:hypothetical protein
LAGGENSPGVVAIFILVNSLGACSAISRPCALPPNLPLSATAALLEVLAGTTLGIRLASPLILKALGLVLVIDD